MKAKMKLALTILVLTNALTPVANAYQVGEMTQETTYNIDSTMRETRNAEGAALVLQISSMPTMVLSATLFGFTFAGKLKLILEAQEDAANFVATGGEVRTARLAQAFEFLRTVTPSEVSDADLAQGILTAEIR